MYDLVKGYGNTKHTNNDWAESIQCELYCQQSKYESTADCQTKRIALEKCLFLAVYMRNFLLVQRYVSELSKGEQRFVHMWKEIQDLLNMVKESIKNRRQKDVILYWLDDISYDEAGNMPYLQSVMQNSIVFENAFTYMPHTHPALRAMFLGKKDIDDRVYGIKKFTCENSPVIRLLEEEGYTIKIISGYFNDCFPFQYISEWFYTDFYGPASVRLWDLLSNMLAETPKTLWIVHMMDAHAPFYNSRISDKNYNERNELSRLSKAEIDEQLAFYDSFMADEAFRIYMSDHGKHKGAPHIESQCHILLNIYHNTLKPRRIEQLFSLLDFEILIKQIVINGNIEEREFEREYVEIGDFYRYAYWAVEKIFKNREELLSGALGFKGVVDKDYIYVCYSVGKEWLQKRSNVPLSAPLLFYDCEDDICEPKLLSKYRDLAGAYPEGILSENQFRYSRYLYDLYHNLFRHNNVPERINIINQLLMNYPDNSIAIRTGGTASATLYYTLSKENKEKIWGFIDSNDKCLCSRLGLPVIHPDRIVELGTYGVKAILISSYTCLDMVREEMKAWSVNIDVLDIYACFDESGIECRENFYKARITDEDYMVGFPFDEDM